jgi:glycosyltransferase involved in cell wall biosynthesis
MRIAFLTGIWPPDVGGPATHGPDFSRFLLARGHEVVVVTMGDGEPADRPCRVEVVPRRWPFPIRYGLVALQGARAARRADVLYASATLGASALASLLSRRPLVAKLTSDPAYERARRYGLFGGDSVAFQTARSLPVRLLKALRNASLRRARTIVVPSAFLADIAARWGLDRRRIQVLTNPAPPPRDVEPEQLPPGTFVFVGRLTEAKDLPTAFAAVEQVEGARLVVVGDGPDREGLERLAGARVELRGALPRDEALRVVAGAEAALLSSAWENLPHSAVEALSVGVPVVATAVGGVPEVVHDGVNGLLVPPRRPDELAAAMRRVLEEPGLRERLAAGAKPSVEAISSDAIYTRLEGLLAEAAGRIGSTEPPGAEVPAPPVPEREQQ